MAQLIAAVGLCSTLTLVAGHLMSTASVDLVVWLLVILFVVRALLRGQPRWWLAAGLVVGLGLYNKALSEHKGDEARGQFLPFQLLLLGLPLVPIWVAGWIQLFKAPRWRPLRRRIPPPSCLQWTERAAPVRSAAGLGHFRAVRGADPHRGRRPVRDLPGGVHPGQCRGRG
jgi:hypothetical protein